jgi:hypothetical protein
LFAGATAAAGAGAADAADALLQILTNGLYKPTLHRVLNTAASTPRVSVPFFYEPCFEAVVQPLPQLCRCTLGVGGRFLNPKPAQRQLLGRGVTLLVFLQPCLLQP